MKLVLQTVLTKICEHKSTAGDRLGNAAGGRQRECSLRPAAKWSAASIDEDCIAGRCGGAVGKGLERDANRAHAGKLVVLEDRHAQRDDGIPRYAACDGRPDSKVLLVPHGLENLAIAQAFVDRGRSAGTADFAANISYQGCRIFRWEFLQQAG